MASWNSYGNNARRSCGCLMRGGLSSNLISFQSCERGFPPFLPNVTLILLIGIALDHKQGMIRKGNIITQSLASRAYWVNGPELLFAYCSEWSWFRYVFYGFACLTIHHNMFIQSLLLQSFALRCRRFFATITPNRRVPVGTIYMCLHIVK